MALALVVGGVTTVAVATATPAAAAINAADFQQVTLAKGLGEVGEPLTISVLPDRSVLHTARNGTLRRTDANGTTSVIGNIPVYTHDEEGLQGVAADPNFATNRYVYLYYAPPLSTPSGDAPATGNDSTWATWAGVNRLSRFTLNSNFTVNMSSQVNILDVPANRGICCHVGGDIDFDAAGNLYLSTGDDSNPFDSAGYSPLDERTNRNPAYDAQRSAGNTNDLRGKILRIKVNANGTYSIPSGNLFPPGHGADPAGDLRDGVPQPLPDDASTRRPAWSTSVTTARTQAPPRRRAARPGRSSSTGSRRRATTAGPTAPAPTPPPRPTTSGTSRRTAPERSSTAPADRRTTRSATPAGRRCRPRRPPGSATPATPVARPSSAAAPSRRWPARCTATTRRTRRRRSSRSRWTASSSPPSSAAAGSSRSRSTPTAPAALIDSFPWIGKQVIDLQFGPDGSLYVLDYGAGFGNGDANSALYRFDYVGSGNNRAPTAVASASPTSGTAPLTVSFSSAGSSDPDGGTLTYSWAFGDGTTSTAANPTKTYSANGSYTATLTVRDPQGATGTSSVQVSVGNTAPKVIVNLPSAGQLVSFGDSVPWSVTVTDPEDGTIDCSKVTMAYVLGHDQHAHKITDADRVLRHDRHPGGR